MPDHMELMMKGALGGIRNIKHDYIVADRPADIGSPRGGAGAEGQKAEAGGYLWRKLGMLGLVTGAHTFQPKQFMHTVRSRRIKKFRFPNFDVS